MNIVFATIALLSAGVSAFAAIILARSQKQSKPNLAENKVVSSEDVQNAKARANDIIMAAKNEALDLKRKVNEEVQKAKQEAFEVEKRIAIRQEQTEQQSQEINRQKQSINDAKKSLQQRQEEIEAIKKQELQKLEKVAQLSTKEARDELLGMVDKQLSDEVVRKIKIAEESAKEDADSRVKEILALAMQRAPTTYVEEFTVATIPIPDDEMKGRIIGKEGRNIRSFEMATGTDVIIDETPNTITISCFDGMRREIARVAMQELISDGRIHPARIETVVEKIKQQIEKITYETGKQLTYDAGVNGLPKEIVELLGRFKYRTSYGQNMIKHTLEVVNLGKILAAELGADLEIVKKAALLHDIGKVLTADVEGSHVDIGVDLLKQHSIDARVIEAVASHHDDEFDTLEAVVVYIADAISGARPGARRENQEAYIRRIKELENTAMSFEGIDQAYAISAGREVRVIVKPKEIDDAQTVRLAHDIVEKIHHNITYPGQVKVTVIRDFRATAVAK